MHRVRLEVLLRVEPRHKYRHDGLSEQELKQFFVRVWFIVAAVTLIVLVEHSLDVQPDGAHLDFEVRHEPLEHLLLLAKARLVDLGPIQTLHYMDQ